MTWLIVLVACHAAAPACSSGVVPVWMPDWATCRQMLLTVVARLEASGAGFIEARCVDVGAPA